jgi:hypothetical protein
MSIIFFFQWQEYCKIQIHGLLDSINETPIVFVPAIYCFQEPISLLTILFS